MCGHAYLAFLTGPFWHVSMTEGDIGGVELAELER